MRKKKQVDAGSVNERPKRGAAAAAQTFLPSSALEVLTDPTFVSSGDPTLQAGDEFVLMGRKALYPIQPNVPPSVGLNVLEYKSKTVVKMSSEYHATLQTVQQVCDAIDAEVELRSTVIRALTAAQYSSFKAQMDLQLSKFSLDEQNMPLEEYLALCPRIALVTRADGTVRMQSRSSSYPMSEECKRNLQKVKDSTSKGTNFSLFTPCPGPRISASQLRASENEEQEQKSVGVELGWTEYNKRLQSLRFKPGLVASLGTHSRLNTPTSLDGGLKRGITPKTLRLPKHGEMMLSVNGSPLGHYGKTPGSTGGARILRTARLASLKRSLKDL